MPQAVHHFRQILVWPLQVMPIRERAQIQEPWDVLLRTQDEHAWREMHDEFGCSPAEFKERHYSEFVTFLPYVRNFLYGSGTAPGQRGDGIAASRVPPQRRREGPADASGARPTRRCSRSRTSTSISSTTSTSCCWWSKSSPTTCRSRERRTSCTASGAPTRRSGPKAAAATAWKKSSGSAPTARCWRCPITKSGRSTCPSSPLIAHPISPRTGGTCSPRWCRTIRSARA